MSSSASTSASATASSSTSTSQTPAPPSVPAEDARSVAQRELDRILMTLRAEELRARREIKNVRQTLLQIILFLWRSCPAYSEITHMKAIAGFGSKC